MTSKKPKLIKLRQAKELGLIYYFTGLPCPKGHVSKRRVINRACWDCHYANWKDRYRRNPAAIIANAKKQGARRRARKAGAEGSYTKDDLARLFAKQQGKCSCGQRFDMVQQTVDHKTPLSRGGSNWPRNLQLLCQPCNDSKGTKTQREWRS